MDCAKESILVVDDDEDGREALTLLLEEAGYEIRQASSGDECLVLMGRALPDLVILDVSMPGLDGLETLRQLRERHRGLPVILLTGHRIDAESIGTGLVLGAEEYLIKPVRPHELKARVRALLDRSRVRRTSESLRIEQMAMLVHDLRQPLAAVALRGEFLAEEGGTTEVQRLGESIRSSCQQMNFLINAVLTLARRAATGMELERKRSLVESIVAEVVEQLRPIAERRQIALTVEAPGRNLADVDEFRLVQVLHNLLGNALKFTPQRGTIAVHCEGRGDWIELSVEDSGPGIAPEDARRIFERWVQTDVGREQGGTGLGLAIAREIVEAHGGEIHCEARHGQGARFWFTLPTAVAPAAATG
jgi:two-component system sensor histidine kinase/response regulator